MATPTLPHGMGGKPLQYFLPGDAGWAASSESAGGGATSSVQVSPPSREVNSPLPAPPLVRLQGLRRACHMPANRTVGAFGSRLTSEAPVSLMMLDSPCRARTRFQVLPPSRVR